MVARLRAASLRDVVLLLGLIAKRKFQTLGEASYFVGPVSKDITPSLSTTSGELYMLFRPTLGIFVLSAFVVGASSGCRSTDPAPSMSPQPAQHSGSGTSFGRSQAPSSGVPLANGYAPPLAGSQTPATNSFVSSNAEAGYSMRNDPTVTPPASGSRSQVPTSGGSSSRSSGCCSN